MNFWHRNKYAFLSGLIVLTLMMVLYYPVFLSPNSFIFAPSGDGLRNYYAYIYHGEFDSGFWDFSGMNYPFGENIVYTDSHPLLSYIVGVLGLSYYSIGILNFLMIISFPIAAVFIFKIFTHFKVAILWAVTAAVVITLLSPQIQRLSGHLAMSYAFVIPFVWWMLIKFRQGNQLKWSIYISVFIGIFFFTHPYVGMIMISFIFAFFIVTLISEKGNRLKNSGYFFIQAIIPLAGFRILLMLNDSHLNRVGEPAGFFGYYASWKSFFVPFFGPMSHVKKWLDINIGNWESWNYVGFSTIVFGLVILFFLANNIKKLEVKSFLKTDLSKFMIAASLVLMFAFCFPFKFWWAKWITEYFGAIKQFRVLGRFGWVFFYVFILFIIVILYRIKMKTGKHKVFNALFFLGMVFTLIEAFPVHKMVSQSITTAPNYFHKENLTSDMDELVTFANAQEYDAIMFLPFTHLSSENIMLLGNENATRDGFILSYHTQTPLMNSLAGRMSVSESKMYNNFFGPEFVQKDLINHIPDDANILLVKSNEFIPKRELPLIWSQEKIFENQTYKAFTFDMYKYCNATYYSHLIDTKKNDSINEDHYLNSFENKEDFIFSGTGSYQGVKDGWHVIDTVKNLAPGTYKANIWYYLGVNRPDMVFNAERIYLDSNVFAGDFDIKQSTHIVEDWCLSEIEFEVDELSADVRFSIIGNTSGEPFFVDELMVYPDTSKIFEEEKKDGISYLIFNNYRVAPWE